MKQGCCMVFLHNDKELFTDAVNLASYSHCVPLANMIWSAATSATDSVRAETLLANNTLIHGGY